MYAWIKDNLLAIVLAAALACVLLGGYSLHDNRKSDAEYRAINKRIGQIDSDIKSEFRNLHQTIDRGRKETGDTRVIVESVRGTLEKDRATIGELQDTSSKLKTAIREIRTQKQTTANGK